MHNTKESRQLLLRDQIPEVTINSLYLPPEEFVLSEQGECPDCDCMLEQFYDVYGHLRYFCDNCHSSVRGLTTITSDDMDITQQDNA